MISILSTVALGLATAVAVFFTKLYKARMLLVDRKRRGLPVAPGHSFLFGHLLYLKSFLDRFPPDAHYQYGFATIAREEFKDTGAFYIDLWPMSGLYFAVVSPQIGSQVTQTNPKLTSERPVLLQRFLRPITGGLTIFDLPEKSWKPWRAAFNKGFHSDRIMSLVPGMVEEVSVYAETLRGLAAKKDLCFLDPITLRFTIDMIGKTILNTSLGAQKGYNTLADSMLSQLSWHNPNAEVNPFSQLDFIRAFVHWNNGRKMNRYIGRELDKRYEAYKADPTGTTTANSSKSVIDLVLEAYMSSSSSSSDFKPPSSPQPPSPPPTLDPSFRAFATRQIRLFIFAGYDSTASLICYAFHLLSQHPSALSTLRAEHARILGPDPSTAPSTITHNPRILNSLDYTLAIIKETLRLFPPAAATRAGKPGVSVTDDAGTECPTDESIIFIIHAEMHRSPYYWVRPDEFLPERWLVAPGHELYPMQGAWRPFELGPRNCIAQALVLVELRVVLACLVRSVEVGPAYGEWERGNKTVRGRECRGERAYQVEKGAAHPVGGYPCWVRVVGEGEGEGEEEEVKG